MALFLSLFLFLKAHLYGAVVQTFDSKLTLRSDRRSACTRLLQKFCSQPARDPKDAEATVARASGSLHAHKLFITLWAETSAVSWRSSLLPKTKTNSPWENMVSEILVSKRAMKEGSFVPRYETTAWALLLLWGVVLAGAFKTRQRAMDSARKLQRAWRQHTCLLRQARWSQPGRTTTHLQHPSLYHLYLLCFF